MFYDQDNVDELTTCLGALAEMINETMQEVAEFFNSIFRYFDTHGMFPKNKFRPLILRQYVNPIIKHQHLPYLQQIYNRG